MALLLIGGLEEAELLAELVRTYQVYILDDGPRERLDLAWERCGPWRHRLICIRGGTDPDTLRRALEGVDFKLIVHFDTGTVDRAILLQLMAHRFYYNLLVVSSQVKELTRIYTEATTVVHPALWTIAIVHPEMATAAVAAQVEAPERGVYFLVRNRLEDL